MMKFGKILLLPALATALIVSVTACGGGETVCTSHVDDNKDLICDNCQASLTCTNHEDSNHDGQCDVCYSILGGSPSQGGEEEEIVEVDYLIRLSDNADNPIAGAVLNILYNGEVIDTATTDENGLYEGVIETGTYFISYEVSPEGYLATQSTLHVTKTSTEFDLILVDNTPIGTIDRPFIPQSGASEWTIPAGETVYFAIPHPGIRALTIAGMGITMTCETDVFTTDAGNIEVLIVEDDTFSTYRFSLKGSESADTVATITLESPLGSTDNPIKITETGADITATVSKSGKIYYTWTATASGTLTVTSAQDYNNIDLQNATTSTSSGFSNGAESVSIAVSEGDVLVICVASLSDEETSTVTFALTIA